MRSKCIEIAYLVRVERANLNAAGTEGSVTLLKKIRDIDGNEYVYVSGVAVKYWIKETLKRLGFGKKLSPVLSKGEKNPKWGTVEDQVTSVGDPENYIDDDLFGYLLPNANRKRMAPVKTNGLISIFPYTGDINIGVRYDPKGGKEHSLWDIEITNTVLRGNWLIEVDRIGKFCEEEIGEKKEKELDTKEKEERIKAFFQAFFDLFGGAKQSSFLTSIEPRIVCILFLNKKKLAIFDRLKINEEWTLDKDTLLEGIKLHKEDINEVIIGVDVSFIKVNVNSLKKEISKIIGKDKVKVDKLAKIKNYILAENFKIY